MRTDGDLAFGIWHLAFSFTIKCSKWSRNNTILKDLQNKFTKELDLADVILPYCDVEDYQYFPDVYIKERIIPTKSANKAR